MLRRPRGRYDAADLPPVISSCRPAIDAQVGGVALTRYASEKSMQPGDTRTVFALIPDGVDQVAVADLAGASDRVSVRGSVVRVESVVGGDVSFTDAQGQEQVLVSAAAQAQP